MKTTLLSRSLRRVWLVSAPGALISVAATSLRAVPSDASAVAMPLAASAMGIALLLVAILLVAGLVLVFAAAARAPEGFEDETGFHPAPRPSSETPPSFGLERIR
jgi:hypothetical protein